MVQKLIITALGKAKVKLQILHTIMLGARPFTENPPPQKILMEDFLQLVIELIKLQ